MMFARAGVVVIIGLLAGKLLGRRFGAMAQKCGDQQAAMLVRRGVFHGVTAVAVLWAMGELNFRLSVVLGTAGVLSVALGFASQTSASNLISGLFLIGERSFAVGDLIRIGDKTGEVLSVDWLSVKLRTFDNLFVRVPNETLIKSEVTNLTRFPIRRVDLTIGVAYKEDLRRVREVLLEVADSDPLCLEEPRPLLLFERFGESSLDLQFSVWTTQDVFAAVRYQIAERVKQRFDEEGIEIPFPHRTLYPGSVAGPLSIRIEAPNGPNGSAGEAA
ncbi:MAG: mechanosensitive ion channel family protein [Acidobacteriota bacterium]|nr:MAG: mechanosensitive ion channel family protein [Acidobacteriota bacterium]